MQPANTSQMDTTMGRTYANVKLSNYGDIEAAERGNIAPAEIRELDIEFLVDTGAAFLCLPPSLIHQLGLRRVGEQPVVTANGRVKRGLYGPVQFEVMDRDGRADIMELPEGTPPLFGYIPLEIVDLVVNPKSQCLEGNPRHDGEWVVDMY